MANVAFPTEYILPIRRLSVRSVARPRRRITSWPWRAIADAASGLAFLGVLGWAVWHLGVQFLHVAGMMEAQVAAAGMGGLF